MNNNDRLIKAVQMASRKLASTGKFDALMKDVLAICVQEVGATGGTIYLHDSAGHRLKFQHVLPEDVADKLPAKDIPEDFGVAGQAFQSRSTVMKEWPEKPDSERNPFEQATGISIRSMIATPLMMEDEEPLGVVQLLNKKEGPFNANDAAVLDTISAVATMAYSNYRLTEESSKSSSLIGMGKVSHDIGNLAASLYASLGYSDLSFQTLKQHLESGGTDAETQEQLEEIEPMFSELKNSVDRIVGYSRLISDISVGRALRPNKKMGLMGEAVEGSAWYLASDARKNKVELIVNIEKGAPETCFDELYVFRIVQNLVGNAIKAVRETIPDEWMARHTDPDDPETYGEVEVSYAFESGSHLVKVRDSGPGMTREIAERILSGNAKSQWDKGSGSGWGTKIVLELALTHDAKVSIDSVIGEGSTFIVTIPHSVA